MPATCHVDVTLHPLLLAVMCKIQEQTGVGWCPHAPTLLSSLSLSRSSQRDPRRFAVALLSALHTPDARRKSDAFFGTKTNMRGEPDELLVDCGRIHGTPKNKNIKNSDQEEPPHNPQQSGLCFLFRVS